MLTAPFLMSPPDVSHRNASPAAAEARPLDVTREPASQVGLTSYAHAVTLSYLIPMSVTASSVGMYLATRNGGPAAGGFLLGGGLGLMSGVVAPPIVHLSHGNLGRGAGSFAGSLLSTAAGGFLGLALTPELSDEDLANDPAPAIAAVTVGALAFQGVWCLIDANELAYETREVKAAQAARYTAPKPVASVFAAPRDGGALLGLQGSF